MQLPASLMEAVPLPPVTRSQFTRNIDDLFGLQEEDEEPDDSDKRNDEKQNPDEK